MAKKEVKEISLDMLPNMALAARNCFIKSSLVIDRFYVVRLVCDAMQHLRTHISVFKPSSKPPTSPFFPLQYLGNQTLVQLYLRCNKCHYR